MKEIPAAEDEALVLMGHGSLHYANFVYAALNYRLRELGYQNVHIGTVEAWPSLESVSAVCGRRIEESDSGSVPDSGRRSCDQ